MNCISLIPAGAARNACLLDQPTNLFFMKKGKLFSNYLDVKNLETWRVAIQEALEIYPTLDIRNVTATKPAENKETDGTGAEVTTRLSPGSAMVNLKTNACDFKEMLRNMQSDYYSIVIGLGSEKVMVLEHPDGQLGGFTGQVTAIPFGYAGKDAKLEDFQVGINWDNVEEWNNVRIIEMPVFLKELVEYTPLGLDVQIEVPLTGTDMEVFVSERCSDEGLSDTFTAEVVSSNVDTPSVTVGVGVDGKYTLTIEKDSVPAPLVAGDYIEFRLVELDTSIYKHISNTLIGRLWS